MGKEEEHVVEVSREELEVEAKQPLKGGAGKAEERLAYAVLVPAPSPPRRGGACGVTAALLLVVMLAGGAVLVAIDWEESTGYDAREDKWQLASLKQRFQSFREPANRRQGGRLFQGHRHHGNRTEAGEGRTRGNWTKVSSGFHHGSVHSPKALRPAHATGLDLARAHPASAAGGSPTNTGRDGPTAQRASHNLTAGEVPGLPHLKAKDELALDESRDPAQAHSRTTETKATGATQAAIHLPTLATGGVVTGDEHAEAEAEDKQGPEVAGEAEEEQDEGEGPAAEFWAACQASKDFKCYEQHGSMYAVSLKSLTWEEAEARCVEMGAHLVSIHNEKHNRYIASKFQHGFWIGLRYNDTSNKWAWTDGSPFEWNAFNGGVVPDRRAKAGLTASKGNQHCASSNFHVAHKYSSHKAAVGVWDNEYCADVVSTRRKEFACSWTEPYAPRG